MTKADGKKATEPNHKVLQFDPARRLRGAAPKLSEEVKARVHFWQEEIDQLRERQFTSLEEALQTLIASVTTRMEDGSRDSDKEREFLYDLLSTDPGVMAYLQSVLKIG